MSDSVPPPGFAALLSSIKGGRVGAVKSAVATLQRLPASTEPDGAKSPVLAALTYHDDGQYTPLHHACAAGSVAVVRFLIEQDGVDETAVTAERWSPLHVACKNGNTAVARFLIQERGPPHVAKPKGGWPLLPFCCLHGHVDLVRFFMHECECRADEPVTSIGERCVHWAARGGHVPVLRVLVDEARAPLDVIDAARNTPLHTACQNNKPAAAAYILSVTKPVDAAVQAELFSTMSPADRRAWTTLFERMRLPYLRHLVSSWLSPLELPSIPPARHAEFHDPSVTVATVLSVLASLDEKYTANYRLRLLVLGDERSGKTRLVNTIAGKPVPDAAGPPPSVDVHMLKEYRWSNFEGGAMPAAHLSLCDCSSLPHHLPVHRTVLNADCVTVITVSLQQLQDDEAAAMEALVYWLDIVADNNLRPSVAIVVTQLDRLAAGKRQSDVRDMFTKLTQLFDAHTRNRALLDGETRSNTKVSHGAAPAASGSPLENRREDNTPRLVFVGAVSCVSHAAVYLDLKGVLKIVNRPTPEERYEKGGARACVEAILQGALHHVGDVFGNAIPKTWQPGIEAVLYQSEKLAREVFDKRPVVDWPTFCRGMARKFGFTTDDEVQAVAELLENAGAIYMHGDVGDSPPVLSQASAFGAGLSPSSSGPGAGAGAGAGAGGSDGSTRSASRSASRSVSRARSAMRAERVAQVDLDNPYLKAYRERRARARAAMLAEAEAKAADSTPRRPHRASPDPTGPSVKIALTPPPSKPRPTVASMRSPIAPAYSRVGSIGLGRFIVLNVRYLFDVFGAVLEYPLSTAFHERDDSAPTPAAVQPYLLQLRGNRRMSVNWAVSGPSKYDKAQVVRDEAMLVDTGVARRRFLYDVVWGEKHEFLGRPGCPFASLTTRHKDDLVAALARLDFLVIRTKGTTPGEDDLYVPYLHALSSIPSRGGAALSQTQAWHLPTGLTAAGPVLRRLFWLPHFPPDMFGTVLCYIFRERGWGELTVRSSSGTAVHMTSTPDVSATTPSAGAGASGGGGGVGAGGGGGGGDGDGEAKADAPPVLQHLVLQWSAGSPPPCDPGQPYQELLQELDATPNATLRRRSSGGLTVTTWHEGADAAMVDALFKVDRDDAWTLLLAVRERVESGLRAMLRLPWTELCVAETTSSGMTNVPQHRRLAPTPSQFHSCPTHLVRKAVRSKGWFIPFVVHLRGVAASLLLAREDVPDVAPGPPPPGWKLDAASDGVSSDHAKGRFRRYTVRMVFDDTMTGRMTAADVKAAFQERTGKVPVYLSLGEHSNVNDAATLQELGVTGPTTVQVWVDPNPASAASKAAAEPQAATPPAPPVTGDEERKAADGTEGGESGTAGDAHHKKLLPASGGSGPGAAAAAANDQAPEKPKSCCVVQ